MEITQEAIEIIKAEETLQLEAYQDGESVSIGYGHSNLSGGEQFELGDTITEEKAEELLVEDLKEIERIVNQRMENYGVTLTQGQYDAMVVGTYNRPEQLKSKKIYTTLASGDMDAITEAWNKTVSEEDKEKYPGLVNRIESELGLMKEDEEVMPDDGDPDRGIPEPVPGYNPAQPTEAQRERTPFLTPSELTQYTSQVPLAAQNKAYERVRQMLQAQVNKQKKQAGHTPYIPGVPPQVTFSDAVQAALKLLGR